MISLIASNYVKSLTDSDLVAELQNWYNYLAWGRETAVDYSLQSLITGLATLPVRQQPGHKQTDVGASMSVFSLQCEQMSHVTAHGSPQHESGTRQVLLEEEQVNNNVPVWA